MNAMTLSTSGQLCRASQRSGFGLPDTTNAVDGG
ncbi:hypothetical protein SBA3_2260015 [Candidatus Sulfopaludibacter sp. SbA3]|nr:hypothetical protein SBA3_2260015 [Candidatus Sulfopaludibacter sp. SbA3]